MSTSTVVTNMALRKIGVTRIRNLSTDNSRAGRTARDVYDDVRRALLGKHSWNFAMRRAQLTASATSPTFGWDYAYPLPDDFVRMVSAHPTDSDDALVPYRLENQSSDDRVLLTQSNQIYIRYVFDLQDVAIMPSYFRDVFAFQMARELAAALNLPLTNIDLSDRAFRKELANAKTIDGQEDWPERMAEGSWVTDRDPNTDWAWD